jgi:eukaryotic-like serine/threonine-protein kinase
VSRLHSPHTIRFYDAGRMPTGTPYIVMELLFGQTLRERLDEDIVLPPLEVLSIVRQISCSLFEAHEAGVWHRDLKPENVHFCHQATPMQPFLKLLDFGLAKLLDNHGPDDPTLTGARQTVGTPAYMAPEMIVEERQVDHRSDIYALGVMIFEMLTGGRPFLETSSMQMALAHVRHEIPSAVARNPKLPAAIDGFFQCVMAKKPELRPQYALDVAQLLADCLGDRRVG